MTITDQATAGTSGKEPDEAAAKRAAYISGLRKLADILEQHPAVPPPSDGFDMPITLWFTYQFDDPRSAMAEAARTLPCNWTKNVLDVSGGSAFFNLAGSLDGLLIELTAHRDQVCTITSYVDREVEVVVQPAVKEKVVKPVPVWECGSLLAPKPAASAG